MRTTAAGGAIIRSYARAASNQLTGNRSTFRCVRQRVDQSHDSQRKPFRAVLKILRVHFQNQQSAITNQQSIESNPVVGVPGTGIGENDLISGLQAAQNLDRVNRAFAELYRSANGF